MTPPAHPPSEANVLGLTRQARDTAASTLSHVGKLRTEVIERLDRQDRQIDFVAGQLAVVVDEARAEREERAAIRLSEHQAQIEARRTDQLALLDERKAAATHRRNVVIKVIAALGAAWAAVSAYLLGGP